MPADWEKTTPPARRHPTRGLVCPAQAAASHRATGGRPTDAHHLPKRVQDAPFRPPTRSRPAGEPVPRDALTRNRPSFYSRVKTRGLEPCETNQQICSATKSTANRSGRPAGLGTAASTSTVSPGVTSRGSGIRR